jgi:LacI family transcriptional regulator
VPTRQPTDQPGPATIRDVATAAGVSIATVSRVLRGRDVVAATTRDRVLSAIEELRFTPSRLGRSLAERQHAASGIVFPDLSGPYFAEVVLGYEEVASDLGRSVLILSTHGRWAAREMVLDLAGRVDGMVIFGRTVSDQVVQEIAARGMPLVMLARPTIGSVDSVNAENHHSATALAAHLVAEGRHRPALVGSPDSSPDVAERWAGLTEAFTRSGPGEPAQIAAGFSVEEGERVGAELLSAGRLSADRLSADRLGDAGYDALLCANDELALGVLSALRSAGVDVPGTVAVTGWDDVMAAGYAGLTTVRQPMRELGATAAHVLDERLRGDRTEPRHELLATRLVVRSSCGHHEKGTP